MRSVGLILVLIVGVITAVSCGPRVAATPTETFKTYVRASQKKDAAAMKVLLSDATIRMYEQEAEAQKTKVEDVLMRESFIGEGQRTVEYRNEKVDGDKATLEYKTSYGMWNIVGFVREDGDWKIDKQAALDRMLQDMDESKRALDNIINGATPLY